VNASAHRHGAVVGAFAYLQAVSLYNNVRQRLLRLRQPKYLIGALVGVAYIYFFLFHRAFRTHGSAPPGFEMSPGIATTIASLVALGLLLYVCGDWIFGSEKAQLSFSESEIDFLFPAPLTRTALIHFSLLRSQLAIFFSAFLIGLLLRRGGGFSGHPLQYITGFWLLMSTLKLHGIAAPFTRTRLLGLGLPSWLRRVLAAVVVLAIAIAFFVRHGLAHGFRDWEITLLAAAWTVPLISRGVAGATTVPLGRIAMLALYTITICRAVCDLQDTQQKRAPLADSLTTV
jgi:hypothetical protein